MCQLKKNIHNLKVESYFFFFLGWKFLGLQIQKTVPQITSENSSSEVEGARLYRSFTTKGGRKSELQKTIVNERKPVISS